MALAGRFRRFLENFLFTKERTASDNEQCVIPVNGFSSGMHWISGTCSPPGSVAGFHLVKAYTACPQGVQLECFDVIFTVSLENEVCFDGRNQKTVL